MLKSILVLFVTLSSISAFADIIRCDYTEPFFSTEYSMAQQSLTIDSFDGTQTVIKNVSFQILGAGQFELWDKNKNVLQTMVLDDQGSDGMSDFLYPYSGMTTENTQFGVQYGGCESNFLHKWDSSN